MRSGTYASCQQRRVRRPARGALDRGTFSTIFCSRRRRFVAAPYPTDDGNDDHSYRSKSTHSGEVAAKALARTQYSEQEENTPCRSVDLIEAVAEAPILSNKAPSSFLCSPHLEWHYRAPFWEVAAPRALGWDHEWMRPKTWQGIVGRASLKNQRLGFELQAGQVIYYRSLQGHPGRRLRHRRLSSVFLTSCRALP
jgi:hypothetical protein